MIGLTELPKYAAWAIWQNKPTSTTPVNILILVSSYKPPSFVSYLDLREQCLRYAAYPVWIDEVFAAEGRIDDEIPIVSHYRSRLPAFSHP